MINLTTPLYYATDVTGQAPVSLLQLESSSVTLEGAMLILGIIPCVFLKARADFLLRSAEMVRSDSDRKQKLTCGDVVVGHVLVLSG